MNNQNKDAHPIIEEICQICLIHGDIAFDSNRLRVDEISRNVAEGANAILPPDRARWQTTAKLDILANIIRIFLPWREPELNPVENVWEFLGGNWLSNLVLDTYDDIIEAACHVGGRSSPTRKGSPQSVCENGPHRSEPMTLCIIA